MCPAVEPGERIGVGLQFERPLQTLAGGDVGGHAAQPPHHAPRRVGVDGGLLLPEDPPVGQAAAPDLQLLTGRLAGQHPPVDRADARRGLRREEAVVVAPRQRLASAAEELEGSPIAIHIAPLRILDINVRRSVVEGHAKAFGLGQRLPQRGLGADRLAHVLQGAIELASAVARLATVDDGTTAQVA
jgi:hypothetical protein